MISVVMATYNGEKYLIEQLDSIRNQTVAPDEVIICDDGSKDSTPKMVTDYIMEYNLSNWFYTVNEVNLGYGNNFHQAVNRAKGDYIFFSDQDDLWVPEKIETMIGIMEQHPDCQLLCTDYAPFASDADAPEPPKQILDRMPNNGVLEKISLAPKSVYIGALGCCMCVRKSFSDSIEPYWFDSWAQDDRMWRMAQCANGCYILHKNLVKHRLHGNNTSTYGKYHSVEKRVKLFKDMQAANEQMLKYLGDNSCAASEKKLMQKHICMMDKRIKLLESKNVFISLPLIGYLKYYEKSKSILVEAFIALRRK